MAFSHAVRTRQVCGFLAAERRTAQASRFGNEDLISGSLVRSKNRLSAGLHLRHALRWLGLHLVARRTRRIRRGALGLQGLGVEDAIAPEVTIGERLRVIFESIGRRFGPVVRHQEQLILLHQDKLNMGTRSLDRSRLYMPRDSQTLRISAIPHLVQFADGHVVALAVLYAGVSEISKQKADHHRSRAEL